MPLNEAPPSWDETTEVEAQPSWEDTTELNAQAPAPPKKLDLPAAVQATVEPTDRVLSIVGNPLAAEASALGRKQAKELPIVAPGGLFPMPTGGVPAPEPGQAADIARGVASVPIEALGRTVAAAGRTVRDVLSPTTYLPPELKPRRMMITDGEIRYMTPEEEAARDPLQAGRPLIVPRETMLNQRGSEGARLLASLSTPESIAMLGLGGTSKLAGAVLLGSMAPGVLEDVRKVASSGVPDEEKRDRINNLLLPIILGLQGGYRRGVEGQFANEMRPMEMTGAEMVGRPKGFTPAVPRSAEPVGPPVPSRGLPIDVPATPPEAMKDVSVIAEIRRANALTRQEIQDLFPGRKLSRQEAARLRDQAWGKPGLAPGTPEPEPPPAGTPVPAAQPEPPAAPSAEGAPEAFAKESGWTLKKGQIAGGMAEPDWKKLTPHDAEIYRRIMANQPRVWEFTDRRAGSATQGITFYVPEGSSLETIKAAHNAKIEGAGQAAEVSAKLEPKPGTVRLYHGEGAVEGAGAGGSYFTEDPEYAAQFGKVTYVDVPNVVAAKARAEFQKTGQGGKHFIIPDEFVRQAKPMQTQPGPKVYDITPEEPGTIEGAQKVTADTIKGELDKYDETGEHGSIADLVDAIDTLAAEDPEAPGAATLRSAVDQYRDTIEESYREYGGRGGLDEDAEKAFIDALGKAQQEAGGKPPAAAEPAEPAAAAPQYTGIEATQIAGKPLGDWEKVADVAGLPRGTARAELAKWLAVPNQPSKILSALKNKKRTREVHAPPTEITPVSTSPASTEVAKMDKPEIQKQYQQAIDEKIRLDIERQELMSKKKLTAADRAKAQELSKRIADWQAKRDQLKAASAPEPGEIDKLIAGDPRLAEFARNLKAPFENWAPVDFDDYLLLSDYRDRYNKAGGEPAPTWEGLSYWTETTPSGAEVKVSYKPWMRAVGRQMASFEYRGQAISDTSYRSDIVPQADKPIKEFVKGRLAYLEEQNAQTRAKNLRAQKRLAKQTAVPPAQQTPVPATPVTAPAKAITEIPATGPIPPNSAVLEVVNYNRKLVSKVIVPYDGTPEDALRQVNQLRAYAEKNFEWKDEVYWAFSRFGATDTTGKLKWVMAPNATSIAEAGTPQARYILGDLKSAPEKVKPTEPAAALPEPKPAEPAKAEAHPLDQALGQLEITGKGKVTPAGVWVSPGLTKKQYEALIPLADKAGYDAAGYTQRAKSGSPIYAEFELKPTPQQAEAMRLKRLISRLDVVVETNPEQAEQARAEQAQAREQLAAIEKPATPLTPANVAKTPEEKAFRSTAEGQKAMAERGSRTALLMNLNEKIRQLDPNEVIYSPMQLQGMPDSKIDAVRDDLLATYNRLTKAKAEQVSPQISPENKAKLEQLRTNPPKPILPTKPEAEVEPPSIDFEAPRPGTPEAKSLEERADAATKQIDELSEKYYAARDEAEKAGYGTKRKQAAETRRDKLQEQLSALQKQFRDVRQGARLMRLEHLAQTGDPAQRWAASVEVLKQRRDIAQSEVSRIQSEPGRGGSSDTVYWQNVERARAAEKQARALSDQAYKVLTKQVSKTLRDLGATKEEAETEAGSIVNMQMVYPGTKAVAEAGLRMDTIKRQRLKAETEQKAKALMKEFDVLADTSFERKARDVADQSAADALLKSQREEYQRRKDEQTRKERAEAKNKEQQQTENLRKAKEIQAKGNLQWAKVSDVWTPVEGKAVRLDAAPEHSFFIHRSFTKTKGDQWTITEARTGLRIMKGATQAETIAKANEIVSKFKPGEMAKIIESRAGEPPPSLSQSMGPGAAARAEFEEDPYPSEAAIGLDPGNPRWNKLSRWAQNIVEGVKQIGKRSPEKQTLAQMANAADNIPRVAGQMSGNGLRLRADKPERQAITFLMQALKMSGDGISTEDAARLGELEHAGDPIGYLQVNQTDLETAAQVFMNQGKKLEAQAAIDAAKAMALARQKYAQLVPAAREARKRLDAQYARDTAAGADLDYERWYVPQRHDLDLFTSANRPIILGESRGGLSGNFRKAKVYEDYSSAIQDGFIPRSTDIADLVEHRVNQGERIVQRRALFESMKAMQDPVDGRPLAMKIPRRRIVRPDGEIDYQESVPRGYQPFEVMPGYRLAVHDGYARLMRALTGTSQLSESAVVGTLSDLAAIEKHIGLALDTFHASRTMQAELMLTGKISVGPRQKRGLALVEYSPRDLQLAVDKGEIPQEMADWVTTPKPMEVAGRTVRLSPHSLMVLGLKNGLNMARVADVMYRDWLREVPVTGTVNKWVFDKLTRSAITLSFLNEFERVAKNNPEMAAVNVARKVASDINVFFGNLQKESIFKNPSMRAINQILFLAPNWVEALTRRELRALGQGIEAGSEFIRNPSGGLPHLGTVGKGIGTGLAAYFAATQMVNLFTRGTFTFQNPEENHRFDAWIPDWTGRGKGFFISPLSVFGEITHDLIRFAQSKPDIASAIQQIGQNKLGNLGRFLEVLTLGRDPMTGEKIIGTANRAMHAGINLVPIPISVSQAVRAGAAAALPGVVDAPQPGSVQRQVTASAGFKTEPAESAQMRVYRLADLWKTKSTNPALKSAVERRLKEDFGPSDYRDLRTSLSRGDLASARRAYEQLLESKRPEVIRQAIMHPHPFTGSERNETKFRNSLTPEQRQLYRAALQERRDVQNKFSHMLRERGD